MYKRKDDDLSPLEAAQRNEFNNVIPLPPPSTVGPGPTTDQQGPAHSNQSTSTIISFPEVVENSDENALVKNMEFTDKTIRLGFIRKVYSIVSVQLLITGLIIFGCMQDPRFGFYAKKFFWAVLGLPMIVYFTTFLCMLACEGPRRKVPYNYIFLLLFTMSLGMMVGVMATMYSYKEVVLAGGITFIIVLALTLFAFQTKIDFTILAGSCLSIVLALMMLGIALMVTSYGKLRLVYMTICVIIISIYIVSDTQMIIGGEHRYSISAEEYVFAALLIYVDIMYLFVKILRMIKQV